MSYVIEVLFDGNAQQAQMLAGQLSHAYLVKGTRVCEVIDVSVELQSTDEKTITPTVGTRT